MMVNYRTSCCVPGCTNRTSVRHRLPTKDLHRFTIWKKLIRNHKFEQLSNEIIHSKFRICNDHFKLDCFSPGTKRLNANCIPSLHLPVEPQRQETNLDPACQNTRASCSSMDLNLMLEVESQRNEARSEPVNKSTPVIGSCAFLEVFPEAVHTPSKNISEVCALSSELDLTTRKSRPSRRDDPISTPKRRRGISERCRRPLLKDVSVLKSSELTPKAYTLYGRANYFKRLAKYHCKKNLSYQKRLEEANRLSEHTIFSNIKLNPVARRFIMSQIETSRYKPKGRRFLLEDKILALSLYKQSGKGYRLLSRIFNLPTRKVLTDLLAKVPFSPGINTTIFDHLKNTVLKLKPQDKYCVLIFDEMSLAPHIHWNETSDLIVGFEDYGHRRTDSFADHVLVFMVRGLTRKWKQPVAYMFCKETTSTPELGYSIKEIIRELRATGLRVLATVCDQGRTNVAAINALLRDTKANCLRNGKECRFEGFAIDNQEVIPLYDPPHLLKGIRNNMLKYNIHFVEDGVQKVAKWKYIEQLFEIDQQQPHRFRSCPKWTKFHVDRNHIKKMKVSNAAQVFSHHAATAMRQIAERPSVGRPFMDSKAIDTADLILFFDELFDSVNGSLLVNNEGKPLRAALSQDSPHVIFWQRAIAILQTMEFREEGKNNIGNVHSLRNWLFTIKGIIRLWKLLRVSTKIKYLPTRSLNQDPVENFFGCIRSYGARQINPTCTSFGSSFKALLVNNFLSLHSVGFNCEVDDNVGALDTLTNFITQGVTDEDPICIPDTNIEPEEGINNDRCVPAWVAGYMVKRLKQKFRCNTCTASFTTAEILPEHSLISRREYCKDKRLLMYPSGKITTALIFCSSTMFNLLPQISHYRGVGQSILKLLNEKLTTPLTECAIHVELVKVFFLKLIRRLVLHFWCKTINRILCGKEKVYPGETDKIKKSAMQRYMKYNKHTK